MGEKNIRTLPYVNIALVAVNVLAFLWTEWGGSSEDSIWMLQHGAMFAPLVIEKKEYYRLFTAVFLHFGVNHLANNMLILCIMGQHLERALGKIKYVLFYALCGVVSNVVSMMIHLHLNERSLTVSAGASGAIFGVIGGLFWAVIRNHGRLENLNSRQLAIMIVLALYFGFTSTGVDNVAHISGLVIGFLLSMLLYRKKNDI